MSVVTEKECRDDSRAMTDQEQDLIHDLGRRLSCLWGYERCIEHASGIDDLQAYWRTAQLQEQRQIDQLRTMISRIIQ